VANGLDNAVIGHYCTLMVYICYIMEVNESLVLQIVNKGYLH
jgi:hypothetical protein